MEHIFLELFNRSIAAGWLILAVIILRALFKRAPKWTVCFLWAMVAVRLACPVSLESVFSLIPSRETVRRDVAVSGSAYIDSGVEFVDNAVNPVLRRSFAPAAMAERGADMASAPSLMAVVSLIWAAGMGALFVYALAGYIRLWLRVRTAVRVEPETGRGAWLRGAVMESEFVDTPFIFGVVRPRIYLPTGMPDQMRFPVVAHEQAHLERRDNLWKLLAYGLLAVYWFHPLCWAAYVLFGRDMELACDEKVIRDYDAHQKRMYSEALLACSMDRHSALVCPLAFGEVGVKERIRSVLRYRKPGLWIMTAAIIACIVAAVCFLTDPVGGKENAAKAKADTEGYAASGQDEAGAGDGGGEEAGSLVGDDGKAGRNGSQEGAAGSGEGQEIPKEAGDEDASAALREELVKAWAEAFVARDGDAIAAMLLPELISEFVSGPEGERSFGFSSPWPVDGQRDVRILDIGEESAEIQYYAWTSDPHVAVWREGISYELQDGKYLVTAENLRYLDDISTSEAFGEAYGECPIDGSGIDYLSNGAGENLNANARAMQFFSLFEPESAALELLNLSKEPSEVELERVYEESGSVNLEIRFLKDEDGLPMPVTMVQPYGPEGIWIPQDHRVDVMDRLMKVYWDEIRRRNLTVTTLPGGWTDVVCIAEIPEADIRLYGYNDKELSGEGVAVEIGDDVNYFDWIYTSPQALLPDCYWNETAQQLQVALRIYTGTGVSAEELHVLQRYDTGTLADSALEISDYWELLSERIQFTFEEETGKLTLFDARDGKELAAVETEEKVESLELGNISEFLLGETILLKVQPGYFQEGWAIAEYREDMPYLEAEVLLLESEGEIRFELGEIRAVE